MTLKNLAKSAKYETYEKDAIMKWAENSFGATIKTGDRHIEAAKVVSYEGYMMIFYSQYPKNVESCEEVLEHLYNNQEAAVMDSLINVYWEIKN